MASMFFTFRIISCFLVLLPLGSLDFICPGPMSPPHGPSYARIESNISGRANEVYAKLRIKLHFDRSFDDKPYKGSVEEAADFWSNVLSVKPVNGRLFYWRDCKSKATFKWNLGKKEKYCLGSCNETTKCFDVEIPNEHVDGCHYCPLDRTDCTKDEPEPGTGVDNADLVFYVSAVDTKQCISGSTVAYASFCDLEPVLERPVFAIINTCPKNVANYTSNAMLIAFKHEMMHALGFSENLFPFFRGKDGRPLWDRDITGEPMNINLLENVLLSRYREWHVRGDVIQRKFHFLVTPRVKDEVRAHFNCSDLEGAELEDYGQESTRKSHFEARVFYDDGMKANINTGKLLFTRLDFALLEDSGWYQVNYSLAENVEFGRNLGCDFSMKSCKFWMDKKTKGGESVEPYCDQPDDWFNRGISCNGTRKLFSGCPLARLHPESIKELHDPDSPEPSTELPRKYQNFDRIPGVDDNIVPEFGSTDAVADFCPVPKENFDVTDRVGEAFRCKKEQTTSWEPIPTWKRNPVKEAQDDEDDSNKSLHIGSSVLLVILFSLVVIML